MGLNRFDIVHADLDPTEGIEMGKTRPCLIISPPDMNKHGALVIIAPLTHTRKYYPWRVQCRHGKSNGEIALEHLRSISPARILQAAGTLNPAKHDEVLAKLQLMFS